jgi:hypothetical protein
MKKSFVLVFLLMFVFMGSSLTTLSTKAETGTVNAGTIIKTESSSTLYYVGEDNKIYVFPNANTYFSWFDEFTDIVVVSEAEFGNYTLGGNVYYKPGSLLIKTPTSFRVYGVGINGELRWIESEEVAKKYYGENWNRLVDDVPDAFFTNYKFGKSVKADDDDFKPEELDEEYPTISHNKGLKQKAKIQNRIMDSAERHCGHLQKAVNNLQKRAERWGVEIPSLGDDFISTCTNRVIDNVVSADKKVTVCKYPKGNPAAAHTISISVNALKNHLKNGFVIGACRHDDDDADEDDGDDTTLSLNTITKSVDYNDALIGWKTSILADSKVEYSTVNSFANFSVVASSTKTLNHSLALSDLLFNQTYYFRIISKSADNQMATSNIYSFVTEAEDVTAPVISGVATSTLATSTTIAWNTNETADSKVVYAGEEITDTTAVSTKSNSALTLNHSIVLDGLATSTAYYFQVVSTDKRGNTATSSQYMLETLAE